MIILNFILKICIAIFFGIAVFCVVRSFTGLWQVKTKKWFCTQKKRTLEVLDLSGVELSEKKLFILSIVGPLTRFVLKLTNERRLRLIDKQLPDVLALLGNALKSGLSLSQAIEMASHEVAPPIGQELKRVATKLKLGCTIEDSLQVMSQRLPTEDVSLVIQSIEVLRKTGGNLVETFNTLASTIEGRLRVESRIQVLTSQGVYQGVMLIAMPWCLGVILYLVAPDYMDPLLKTRLGIVLILIGIILEVIGGLWIKKIVLIKV